MHRRRIAVGLLAIGILLLAWRLLWVAEVIDVLAIEDSPVAIYSGAHNERLEVIGELNRGQVAHVMRCVPEKGDVDLEVEFDGKVGLIQGSKFRIHRRPASLSDRTAGLSTTSCYGLLSPR